MFIKKSYQLQTWKSQNVFFGDNFLTYGYFLINMPRGVSQSSEGCMVMILVKILANNPFTDWCVKWNLQSETGLKWKRKDKIFTW